MNRKNVAMELLVLAEAYNEHLSETRITAYLESLEDLPADAVASAMRELRKTEDFFPRISVIRRYVIDRFEREHAERKRGEALERTEGYRIQWEREQKTLTAPIPIGKLVGRAMESMRQHMKRNDEPEDDGQEGLK